MKVSRRKFVGGSLAAGAGIALTGPGTPAADPGRVNLPDVASSGSSVDVVVAGAGIAGLSAARALVAKGYSVVVLEARDRVGGRTLNVPLGGGKVIDVGGQWVGPLPSEPGATNPQARIFNLAAQLGIGTFKTYDTGNYLDYNGGHLTPYTGRIPVNPSTANAGVAQFRLDQMAKTVPPGAPQTAPKALLWDSQTVETWMRQNLVPPDQPPDGPTNSLLNLFVESTFSCEPRDVSLLELITSIASAGSSANIDNTGGGAQDSRFIGGSQLISIRMAEQLGGRVVLNAPVLKITHANGRVTASGDGFAYTGRRMILAMPFHLEGRIQYEPALSSFDGGLRDQLTQRAPMGSTIKVQCLYPTPFWRDAGLAGQVTSDTGPIKITFDNSPYPDSRPGILVGFMEGEDGRVWGARTEAQRRQVTIECFVRYFGSQAANPVGYIEKVWAAEQYTGGCYGSFLPTGVSTSYGEAATSPLGLLHWAGAETAARWNGYMDGAVESAERVTAEVVAALGQPMAITVPTASPASIAALPNTSR
jgi:monoamine oxidase